MKREKGLELQRCKSQILNYFAFKEVGDELICQLTGNRLLVFKIFEQGNTIDLLLRYAHAAKVKEEMVVASFSFEDEKDINILKEYYLERIVRE